MSTTDESTTIPAPTRGHRLRRAAARTAVVLGFAMGGWLVVTGSASADTTPPPPPTPAPLLGGAGALLGQVSTPLTPVVAAVTAPVAQVAPVVAAVVAPVAPVAPVVAAVTAPVAPVVAAVVAPVTATLAPLSSVLAPVAPVVAALAPALAPVLAPVTVTLAPLTAEGPFAVVQGPAGAVGDAVDGGPTQPPAGAVDGVGAVGAPVGVGPMLLPAGPAGWATTAGDPVADRTTEAALPAPTEALSAAPTGGPVDGPVLPVGGTPASPVGAPGSGSASSSVTGLGQLLGVVDDPTTLHLRTRAPLASCADEVSLPALLADPGFSPD